LIGYFEDPISSMMLICTAARQTVWHFILYGTSSKVPNKWLIF